MAFAEEVERVILYPSTRSLWKGQCSFLPSHVSSVGWSSESEPRFQNFCPRLFPAENHRSEGGRSETVRGTVSEFCNRGSSVQA